MVDSVDFLKNEMNNNTLIYNFIINAYNLIKNSLLNQAKIKYPNAK
jgi:hypothetical protein